MVRQFHDFFKSHFGRVFDIRPYCVTVASSAVGSSLQQPRGCLMVLIVAAVVFGDLQSRLISIGLQSLPARKGRSLCPSIVWQPFWFLFLVLIGFFGLFWPLLALALLPTKHWVRRNSLLTKRQIVVLKNWVFPWRLLTPGYSQTQVSLFPTKKHVLCNLGFKRLEINVPYLKYYLEVGL